MKISFGQKIPIAKTQIKSLKENAFVGATVYELDCKDESDFDEVDLSQTNWNYNLDILNNMRLKYQSSIDTKEYFYILQGRDSETLALAQINVDDRNVASLEWLDSKENKPYKFVGQTMMATLAKEILKKGGHCFVVSCAKDDSKPFYINKCGFEDMGKDRLYMDEVQMKKFILKTEEKTGTILDLKT